MLWVLSIGISSLSQLMKKAMPPLVHLKPSNLDSCLTNKGLGAFWSGLGLGGGADKRVSGVSGLFMIYSLEETLLKSESQF